MVANPMQKRARNSFLLGMVITLIVCAIIGVVLYFVFSAQGGSSKEKGDLVTAYVLSQDIKSGDTINTASFKQIKIYENMVPKNYIDSTKLASMQGEYVAKVNMYQNTVVTTDTIALKEEATTEDLRYVEYNMLILPTTIMVGDYIDIRLTLPNGQDLIVVSKKQVKSILGDTIGLELTEGEILMMESAAVEAYWMTASKLYAIQYVEPGNQAAARATYTPSSEVQALIDRNPNIAEEAKTQLKNRFNGDIRTGIDNSKNLYNVEGQQNLEEGIQKEIENAKAAREAYLSGLTSY